MINSRAASLIAVGCLVVVTSVALLISYWRQEAHGTAAPSPISTVLVIVLENESWSDIARNPSAPYLNELLTRPDASYAANYNSPRGLHPSTPNYIWMEAGGNLGITNNVPPSVSHQSTKDHLVTYLNRAGYSWKAYFQNSHIDGVHCPVQDSYPYPNVPFMLPFAFFDDVTGNLDPNNTYCANRIVSDTRLPLDLATNTVANFNFIRAGDCENMHDSCPPLNNKVKQGDDWLSSVVPTILSSRAYQSGAALFITWDEGTGDTDGPMGMIVLSPYARGGGYHNATYYTHSSLLKTIQEIFRVTPLLRDAGSVGTADLSDLFRPGTIGQRSPSRSPG
jgi:phosphatidylinositol-3-phosphatase